MKIKRGINITLTNEEAEILMKYIGNGTADITQRQLGLTLDEDNKLYEIYRQLDAAFSPNPPA